MPLWNIFPGMVLKRPYSGSENLIRGMFWNDIPEQHCVGSPPPVVPDTAWRFGTRPFRDPMLNIRNENRQAPR